MDYDNPHDTSASWRWDPAGDPPPGEEYMEEGSSYSSAETQENWGGDSGYYPGSEGRSYLNDSGQVFSPQRQNFNLPNVGPPSRPPGATAGSPSRYPGPSHMGSPSRSPGARAGSPSRYPGPSNMGSPRRMGSPSRSPMGSPHRFARPTTVGSPSQFSGSDLVSSSPRSGQRFTSPAYFSEGSVLSDNRGPYPVPGIPLHGRGERDSSDAEYRRPPRPRRRLLQLFQNEIAEADNSVLNMSIPSAGSQEGDLDGQPLAALDYVQAMDHGAVQQQNPYM